MNMTVASFAPTMSRTFPSWIWLIWNALWHRKVQKEKWSPSTLGNFVFWGFDIFGDYPPIFCAWIPLVWSESSRNWSASKHSHNVFLNVAPNWAQRDACVSASWNQQTLLKCLRWLVDSETSTKRYGANPAGGQSAMAPTMNMTEQRFGPTMSRTLIRGSKVTNRDIQLAKLFL